MRHGLLYLTAIAGGALCTWIVRRLSLRFGWVSRPNSITADNRKQIALMGGVAVGIGGLIALLTAEVEHRLWRVLLAGLLFLVFGVLDDLRPFSPGRKFVGQALVAAAAVLVVGPSGIKASRPVDFALQLVLVLVLVNAINFTDVCDGLVAGIACVALAGVALVHPSSAPLALAVSGASLGLWFFNRPPAKIFMGDAGTHFVGFTLAELVVQGLAEDSVLPCAVSGLFFVGVPLFETIFITAVRIRKGLPWWRGSPDHFSLRLQKRGWSKWQVDYAAWGATAALTALGVVAHESEPALAVGMLAVGLVGAAAAWRYLVQEPAT